MKILFLSRWYPYPVNNGSKVRILNLLRNLAKAHQVTLLSFHEHSERSVVEDELSSLCEEIIRVPWKTFRPNSFKAVLGFFSTIPRSIIDTFSSEMASVIHRIISNNTFDLVIASQIEMASYASYFSDQTAIFDEVEIGVPLEKFINATGTILKIRTAITWYKHKHYLTRLLKIFPICTVASEEERKLLLKHGIRYHEIAIVPNCINLDDYRDFKYIKKNNTIIFTGSFRYAPNYEAMLWFLEEVFPKIIQAFPEIELIITGDHMDLPLPITTNITTTGFVDDIRQLVNVAAISIVPLLSGGGTRLKVLEAMALYTPVVSTSKGAEGLAVTHQKDILLADAPQDFADAIIQIIQDKNLSAKLSARGFDLVKSQYSSEAMNLKLEGLFSQIQSKRFAN